MHKSPSRNIVVLIVKYIKQTKSLTVRSVIVAEATLSERNDKYKFILDQQSL